MKSQGKCFDGKLENIFEKSGRIFGGIGKTFFERVRIFFNSN